MALCAKCLLIPPKLITSAGWAPYSGGDAIRVEHRASWTDLKRSAEDGNCPCCGALLFLIGIDEAPAGPPVPIVLQKTHWQSFDVQYRQSSDYPLHKSLRGSLVPAEWSSRLAPFRPLTEDDNHIYAKGWLQDCLANHETCSSAQNAGAFVPTRLLDVGDANDDVRLILTAETPVAGPYFALSHCWGKLVIATTTTRNLADWLHSVPLDTLSTTFRDAVGFCRRVGVRYLWIDSLCILQDSRADWEAEAAVMGRVYERALCTLAATCSADGAGGCRVRRPARFRSVDLDLGEDGQLTRIRVWAGPLWRWAATLSGMNEGGDNRMPPGPLNTRAWTLQERQLSARLLHFTEYAVLWECREHRASTRIPWGQTTKERDADWDFRLFDKCPESVHDRRRRWFETVDEYSARNLTVPSDKLPALAGMAQRFGDEGGYGRYVAGLWESHLPVSLLWRVAPDVAERPRDDNLAPSWSWVSMRGTVSHAHLNPLTEIGPGSDRAAVIKQMSRDASPRSTDHQDSVLAADPLAVIHHVDVDYGGKNPFLGVATACITISGKMKEARIKTIDLEDPQNAGKDFDGYNLLMDDRGRPIGAISLDERGLVAQDTKVCCLAVDLDKQWPNRHLPWGLDAYIDNQPRFEDWDEEYRWWRENLGLGTTVLALALIRAGREDEFKRVGLARWIRRDWFEEAEFGKITLV
ncbi:heterokaryon incompatibility protein-domain-containing protein [Podospora aff. communis PSN243]|uniref:Heterokaryon incompatibility protein-domain-containing protein n=1 Tax=Podospora aff. communis PSN243 TaxID=3040156 RepID=A0AAV9G1E5_9PEZI|nr:heterokaryon incompatibility protein-domain-containing protein [Podospora aff. communis PSN243]